MPRPECPLEPLPLVDTTLPTPQLIRRMRQGGEADAAGHLPESVLWHTFLELRRRGEPSAADSFLRALEGLHRRRSLSGSSLPTEDRASDEHKLVDDAFLADLWKAYKRCICAGRPGPAAQLLRDIQARLCPN